MDNFPSIFPYTSSTATPPHLSMDHNSHSYIKFREDKRNNDEYLGLMVNNGSVSSPPDVDRVVSRSSSLVSSESSGNQSMKMGMMKKDKKMKKPRYAFQTRSQVDILDDGYRWRKYGQKAVKNNKFPRSYYRCTYQGCNVKKQVQRLSKDEDVVVTTYEGVHSHPIEKSTDNFEHILTQMKIYTSS